MGYTVTVNITQEIIDKRGVNPSHNRNCLCYQALSEMGYKVDRVDTSEIVFQGPTFWAREYVALPQQALDYLNPLIKAARAKKHPWRKLATPFRYQLELPDEVQPVGKV